MHHAWVCDGTHAKKCYLWRIIFGSTVHMCVRKLYIQCIVGFHALNTFLLHIHTMRLVCPWRWYATGWNDQTSCKIMFGHITIMCNAWVLCLNTCRKMIYLTYRARFNIHMHIGKWCVWHVIGFHALDTFLLHIYTLMYVQCLEFVSMCLWKIDIFDNIFCFASFPWWVCNSVSKIERFASC